MSEPRRKDEIQGEIIHVYDGIEEADNQLPQWWLFTFYGAVIFAAFYWFYYEEFHIAPGPQEAYAMDVAARADRGGAVTDDLLETLARSTSEANAGKAIFAEQCAVCHGAGGGGTIGPNLTDDAWIHGGAPVAIHTTIAEGVMDKGMPAWGASLGPMSVRRVAAYVISLRNTNVPGKPAQGEPYVPGAN